MAFTWYIVKLLKAMKIMFLVFSFLKDRRGQNPKKKKRIVMDVLFSLH